MKTIPKCPYCNIFLETYEAYDDDISSDYYSEKIYGGCRKCNKDFTWINWYKYDGFNNLKEEKG